MPLDVVDCRAFYQDRLGLAARRLICRALKRRWPSLAGETLLGIGFATPYLSSFASAERTIAFMPATQGVTCWPAGGPNATALVPDDALPLPDASIDRVLAVHSLELSARPGELLRELWRVLVPGGKLIAVVPNRRGLWAHAESTPFGVGRPFGRGQLSTLIREADFVALGWAEALAMPPLSRPSWLRTGAGWEGIGLKLWPGFAGVIIVEAEKQQRQPVAVKRFRVPKPALAPALGRPAGAARVAARSEIHGKS